MLGTEQAIEGDGILRECKRRDCPETGHRWMTRSDFRDEGRVYVGSQSKVTAYHCRDIVAPGA